MKEIVEVVNRDLKTTSIKSHEYASGVKKKFSVRGEIWKV